MSIQGNYKDSHRGARWCSPPAQRTIQIENPRFFRKGEKALATLQRKAGLVKHLPRRDPKKIKVKQAVRNAHSPGSTWTTTKAPRQFE